MSGHPNLPVDYRLFSFDRIDSTNSEALRRIAIDADPGDVIWAMEQSRGRGRRDRTWYSPRGNLYSTIIISVSNQKLLSEIAFVAAVGIGEVIRGLLSPDYRFHYKWPNDLLVDYRKVGGILVERATDLRGKDLVAVGIGVNVSTFPSQIIATSLADCEVKISVRALLSGVCESLNRWLGIWHENGFASIRMNWLKYAYDAGEAIEVRMPDGSCINGNFLDIEETGALRIRSPTGQIIQITTGEVFRCKS